MKEKSPSILEIEIKDFRAIKQANIKLDGITVVAGENSCGKSTIAKLLYYTFKISKQYDEFIIKELKDGVRKITKILKYIFFEDFTMRRHFNISREELQNVRNKIYDIEQNVLNKKDEIILLLEGVKKVILTIKDKEHIERVLFRINRIVEREFEIIEEKGTLRIRLEKTIEQIYKEANEKIYHRDNNLFFKKLRNIYVERLEHFHIKEDGISVIKKGDHSLGTFFAVDNAIYVDSPMAVENPEYTNYRNENLEIDKFSHWKDLDYYLKHKNKRVVEDIRDTEVYDEMQNLFSSKEILDGEVVLDEGQDELIFKRNDGKSFKILDCATGIKSIAVLQTLYKNGWLTNKTLLILDEPETHLHPQWIVEYARLLVLLNKKIGVKFLIASHNPDMVSGIQDISDKENRNDNLKFYLAEKQENYTYNFVDKGIDEEDIFESFNIAMDRINKYGGDDE